MMIVRIARVCVLSSIAALSVSATEVDALARQIFETTGVRGGLVVHLGCGDGKLTAALRPNDSFEVHGLDRKDENIAAARDFLTQQGNYGEISVERLDGAQLPYIDNLVNLLVAEDLNGIALDEIKRVLVPNGVAYLKIDNAWQKIVKPRPSELDEWTHYYYDSRGNAVSKDMAVAPPKHLQWLGSPRWSRHHDRMSSLSAMVSSAGRLFYIMDEGSRISILLPSKWTLVARDAFNGVILWKKPIDKWQSQLWPLKSGPTELTRRLVSDGDRVYVTLAIDGPVSCLNGATGEAVRVYDGTKGAEEILFCNGVLYAVVNPKPWALDDFAPKLNTGDQKRVETEFTWDGSPRELHAIDAASGKVLWKKTEMKIAPLTLATDGKRLVFHDGVKIVCLDAPGGTQRWASEPEEHHKLFEYNYGPRLVLHDNLVLYAGGTGNMKGLDGETGKELWTSPHSRSGYRSPEDLIVAGGLVWNAPTSSGNMSGAFSGRNPLTGKVEVEFPPDVDTYWFHHRCYIAKATERFILTSRTGTEFVDIANNHWNINHWVRGACLYGTLPCNGLLYAGPHDCACYPEAKLFGMNALAPARKDDAAQPATMQRLERGPAYDEKFDGQASDPKDWPIYRHDNTRSAFTDQPLQFDMSKNWEITLGGRLSPPVVAAGMLFVAQVDRHTLHALDAVNGKALWHFIAGGRIDSPPAYWRGRVYFGSMDGRVYCLRASDGALVWRFLAAPDARRHVAFEQLESVWPVHGSVLVENGNVNLVAGRSVFLDGGLRYFKLDAASGKQLAETVYDDKDPDTGKDLQTRLKTLQMPVGLNDILSSNGQYIYLRSQKIGEDGKRVDIGPVSGNAAVQGATQRGADAHLFAPMGFTDDSWFHRSYWVYGRNFAGGHNGYYQAGKYTPTGQILAFDNRNVYSFGRKDQYFKWTTTIEDQLSAASREAPDVEPVIEKGPGKKKAAAVDDALLNVPYVRFPDSDKLNPAGQALTVEAWIAPEDGDGIVVSHGGGANGYALAIQDGKPAFSVRSSKESGAAKAAESIEKGWHHVAGVLTAKSIRLYVDGQLASEEKSPGLIAQKPNLRLQLGAGGKSLVSDYGKGKNYTGLLEQFTLYHRALSAKEIEERAKASARKTGTDAVIACEFDLGTARDVSGNKLQGTAHDTSVAAGKFGKALAFRPPKELPKEAMHDMTSDEKDAGPSKEQTPKHLQPDGTKGSFVVHEWTCPIAIYGRAMAVSGETVLVAGPPDLVDEESAFQSLVKKDPAIGEKLSLQAQALDNKSGGSVMAFGTSGDFKYDIHLESAPVWDGMIVAQGRIYISGLDGKIVCFGKE